jgi:hypothetical protein
MRVQAASGHVSAEQITIDSSKLRGKMRYTEPRCAPGYFRVTRTTSTCRQLRAGDSSTPAGTRQKFRNLLALDERLAADEAAELRFADRDIMEY